MIFNKFKLEDITDKIGDGIHGTPEYDDNGEFYFVNGNNLVDGDIVFKNDTKRINEEQYLKHKRNLNRNTLLISINGTLGNIAKYNNEKIILGKSACYANVKDEYNVDYVYFVFESPEFKKYLQYGANGTTIKNVPLSAIRNYEISIPSKENQDKIVKILKSIEDKIKLNNEINNNLFELLKLEFKEKFYNQAEKDSYLIEYISETIGGDWGKENPEGNNNTKVYCVRGADIPNMEYGNKGNAPIRYILEKNYKNKKLDPNNIIIEISGGSPSQSTGRTAYITKSILDMYDSPLLCTNFCRAIETKSDILAPFVYMNLKLMYEDNIFFNWENGTTGIKNMALNDMLSNIEVKKPYEDDLKEYDLLFNSVMNKISHNSNENIKLEQLRDTLLPKLINGEIELENIEI